MTLALHTRVIPIHESLHQLFGRIADQHWAILLESGSPDHPDSRFHILSADPIATLTTHGATTQIHHADGQEQSEEDPLFLIQRWQQRLLGATDCTLGELPFYGGALGFWSYDLGRRFEELPAIQPLESDLPEMAVGIYDWALIIDRQQNQATLLQLGTMAQLDTRHQWLMAQHPTPTRGFKLKSQWQSNLSYDEYTTRFQHIQDYIHSGDCYQINLTQRFEADYQGSEWQAYCELSQENLAPFSAFLRLEQSAILSISPERFIHLRDQKAQTKPIKGTRPRHRDPIEDHLNAQELLNSTKDRAENLMIVDLLRNDFGRISLPGSVNVPSLFALESFAAVHHLVSTITSNIPKNQGATDLLRACFPGGSITGAPKIRAMEIIEELEPNRRTIYCGSIGYLSIDGQMDTSITIRTLLCQQGVIRCWAGGGIVADSDLNEEYHEAQHKVARILPKLAEL